MRHFRIVVASLLVLAIACGNYEDNQRRHRCNQLGEGVEGDANYRTNLDEDSDGVSCEGYGIGWSRP
jgi:hypothetical protein